MTEPGRTEVRLSNADAVALPIFIAVVLLAIVVRQFIPPPPSAITLAVCGALGVLDAIFARWLLRRGTARFVATPDEIRIERPARSPDAKPEVLHRSPETTLSFRLKSNGVVGEQVSYLLKLHDNATGDELLVDLFGKRKVRQACEAQAWQFGDD
ncbi:MAG: hypothetical protein JO246_18235 [Frankiaceae bacterium]|nr:hypothetical protein [Frankiaceae bacterium]